MITLRRNIQGHLVIAFLIFLFAETIGLWFVNHQLDIPQNRYFAANCIYQLSIFSAFIGITQVPYTAVILAHEQMDVYAWLELLNVTLKLVVVWLIQLITGDRLIFYSILVFVVSLTIRAIYRIYCSLHFPESHLSFTWEPKILRKMLSFTGWNLFADASVSVRQQGTNILLNRFFGIVLNASSGIAAIVQGIFWQLGYNIVEAFKPQIIKQYASGNYQQMQFFMIQSLKASVILICMISVPLFIEMPSLLKFWLGDIPPYAVSFCRILLVDNLFGLVNYIINLAFHAQGNIKTLSVVSGILKFLCLPIIYILFSCSFPPSCAYWVNLISLVLILIIDFYILFHQMPQLKVTSFISTFVSLLSVVLVCSVLFFLFCNCLPNRLFFRFASALVFVTLLISSSYFILLNREERVSLNNYLSEWI